MFFVIIFNNFVITHHLFISDYVRFCNPAFTIVNAYNIPSHCINFHWPASKEKQNKKKKTIASCGPVMFYMFPWFYIVRMFYQTNLTKNSQFFFCCFLDVGKYRRAESMRINFTIGYSLGSFQFS